MTALQTVPLAVLIGLLFNLNPSCGSGTLFWVSTQPAPSKMAALALTRIAVLAAVGAVAGLFGPARGAPAAQTNCAACRMRHLVCEIDAESCTAGESRPR